MAKEPLPNKVILMAAPAGDLTGMKGVVCLTQNDMNGTTNNVAVDTFCGVENLPGSLTQTLTAAFRRIWSPGATEISEEFFYNAWKNQTFCDFTVGYLDPVTGNITYTGSGYVSAYNNTNGVNAAPAATMTIQTDAPFELSVEA